MFKQRYNRNKNIVCRVYTMSLNVLCFLVGPPECEKKYRYLLYNIRRIRDSYIKLL